ncbi:hypothetical protein J2855_000756 [Agrobacterium tumefaciens]|jgi:hypothetical protein|uniref:Uncharacterized protein n=1 Tax=Agrobacterium radiobacter TaxID=362 RepID=A0ABR6J496_AGRRD|nr:hypothetical protein L902_35345 [Agrobacterium radiobacter DSM 30147]MBB4281115.1 hypothetical protein [Agrobacterium radiobacter]MBP2507150.1 hypothetical protein [Agrobacterium tumefaciens]MCP2135264.1 hypothetical protein [Rhizobium sp. SLBN-94]MBB4317734.1 hypothetical protein [Agrobacterium radiobacter]
MATAARRNVRFFKATFEQKKPGLRAGLSITDNVRSD